MTDEKDVSLLKLRKVRISFPKIFEKNPRNKKGEIEKPGASFLIHPEENKREMELCQRQIQRVLSENKIPKLEPSRYFFRDGDYQKFTEYHGHWYVASNTRQPDVLPHVLTAGKKIVESQDQLDDFYAGIYCNVRLSVWFQDNEHGQRINAELQAIQVLSGGERIGGGGISKDVALAAFDDEGNEYGPGDDDVDF